MGKEDSKLSLFTGDMIPCVESVKKSTKNPVELVIIKGLQDRR